MRGLSELEERARDYLQNEAGGEMISPPARGSLKATRVSTPFATDYFFLAAVFFAGAAFFAAALGAAFLAAGFLAASFFGAAFFAAGAFLAVVVDFLVVFLAVAILETPPFNPQQRVVEIFRAW